MITNETPPFTQVFPAEEDQGVSKTGLVQCDQSDMERPVSSAVERAPHMRDGGGSTPPPATTLSPIDIAHFWQKVTPGFDFECWPWRGNGAPHYGRFRGEMAHKVAYRLIHGPIREGMIVRHSCDNPPCCNPFHLLEGTHQDNSDDAVERGRTSRGANHGNSRLTAEQVAFIRKNPEGLTGARLAANFGVGRSTISYIRNGRSWKYV